MAVRVTVKISRLSGSSPRVLETAAVVNTGYEAAVAEIALPRRAVEQLALLDAPDLPTERTPYSSPLGKMDLTRIPLAVEVCVVTQDRVSQPVQAGVIVSEQESEALLNDMLVGDLGIHIFHAGRGTWALEGDPVGRQRPSVPPQYW